MPTNLIWKFELGRNKEVVTRKLRWTRSTSKLQIEGTRAHMPEQRKLGPKHLLVKLVVDAISSMETTLNCFFCGRSLMGLAFLGHSTAHSKGGIQVYIRSTPGPKWMPQATRKNTFKKAFGHSNVSACAASIVHHFEFSLGFGPATQIKHRCPFSRTHKWRAKLWFVMGPSKRYRFFWNYNPVNHATRIT